MITMNKISKYLFMAGVTLIGLALVLGFFGILSFFLCYTDAHGLNNTTPLCSVITLPEEIVKNTAGFIIGLIFGSERSDESAGAFFFAGMFLVLAGVGNLIFSYIRQKFGLGVALGIIVAIIILSYIGTAIM